MRMLVLIAAAALASSALAAPVTDADAAQFKIGTATVSDVEAKLGAPQTVEMDAGGVSAIRYAQSRTHVKATTFVPVVGLFAGGAKGEVHVVTFRFKDGVLAAVETSQTNVACKTLGGCQ